LPRVLVTDASERAALAVIRSLGLRGIEVWAADNVGLNAGFLSKYCSKAFIYPSPIRNKSKFIKFMLRFAKKENFELLIPITDLTMVPIVEHKDEFEDYVKIAAPPYDIAVKAFDKAQTVRIAEKAGIPCPQTFLINDIRDLKEVANSFRYPVVIKPRMKVFWQGDQGVMLKVTSRNYAYSSKDLINKYMGIISQLTGIDIPQNFFMVQEFVKGEGYGVEVLMHRGKVKAIFMHKRLREYPVTGGASTLRISTRNEKLACYSVRLLKEMNWQGVAMVEFKINPNSDDVKLMEVNGRFWGSLPLAIKAGVDFPYLLYKCMVERENFSPPSYKLGVKQRWLIPGDILWLYSSIINYHRILSSVKDFLGSFAVSDDVISSDDIAPTIGALLTCLNSFIDVLRGRRNMVGETLLTRNDTKRMT